MDERSGRSGLELITQIETVRAETKTKKGEKKKIKKKRKQKRKQR